MRMLLNIYQSMCDQFVASNMVCPITLYRNWDFNEFEKGELYLNWNDEIVTRDEIKADLDRNDLEAVRQKIAQLQQAAQQMYQAQAQDQAQGSSQNAGGTQPKDENDPHVVDATFEEKK